MRHLIEQFLPRSSRETPVGLVAAVPCCVCYACLSREARSFVGPVGEMLVGYPARFAKQRVTAGNLSESGHSETGRACSTLLGSSRFAAHR